MCQKIPEKSEKILKNIEKIPNAPEMAVIAKKSKISLCNHFLLSAGKFQKYLEKF